MNNSMMMEELTTQKEELLKRKNELIMKLSSNEDNDNNNNYMQKENIYLIKQSDLDEYEQKILNNEEDMNKLYKEYKKFNLIDKCTELIKLLFTKDIKIEELPRVFPLNKNNFELLRKGQNKDNNQEPDPKLVGILEQKLFYTKFNELICFFFEHNNNLRQGYIHIKNKDSYSQILDELKLNPFHFIKNIEGNFNDGEVSYSNNDYNLYVFAKKDELNMDKLKEQLNIIREDNFLKFRSKSVVINYSKKDFLDNFKKIDEQLTSKYKNKLKNMTESSIISNDDTVKKNQVCVGKSNFSFESYKSGSSNNSINNNINNSIKKENDYYNNQSNNNEENIIHKAQIFEENKYELNNIAEPGLVGLDNIGATCYMNATLQCFSNIKYLRYELLNKMFYNYLENLNNNKKLLSFALAEVFKNLWEKLDHKSYPPNNFKELISSMNPLFKGVAANDPKDLILFILETMHNELKTVDNSIIVDENFVPNEHDLIQVYKDFANCYLRNNKSLIFNIFFGCQNIVTTCLNCNVSLYNVQVNNIVFFPLEEIRKFKGKNNNTPVNIYDCFEYTKKIETYNCYYCNICQNNNSQAISYSKYLYAPRVLILNLNRGKGIQYNVKFDFDDNILNIKNYVTLDDSPYLYELVGVICHFGESGMGGHFIAFCKNDYKGKWYKFNDGLVYECDFNEVRTSGMPYVLFYSFMNF